MTLAAAFDLLSLILSKGLPAVVDAYNSIKATAGREPTVDEIRALMTGVEPPEKY